MTIFLIKNLPNKIKYEFITLANAMLNELKENKLVIKYPTAPIQMHSNHKIRRVESRNPEWYSKLYWERSNGQYHKKKEGSGGLRILILNSLDRIINEKDLLRSKYDGILKIIILEKLKDGFVIDFCEVEPNEKIINYFMENYMDEFIEDLTNKVRNVLNNSKKLKENIDELKEWRSFGEWLDNIKKIKVFFTDTIIIIEDLMDEVKNEIQELYKSEIKLNTAVKIIDEVLQLPFYLELFDGPIIKIFVKWTVENLNERYGKGWPTIVK